MAIRVTIGTFHIGRAVATDVYVTPDGIEYMPGYRPANATLIHRND